MAAKYRRIVAHMNHWPSLKAQDRDMHSDTGERYSRFDGSKSVRPRALGNSGLDRLDSASSKSGPAER